MVMSMDCGDSLCNGELYDSAGGSFCWIFSGIYVSVIGLWIACSVFVGKPSEMCSHSTVSSDIDDMEIEQAIKNDDPMSTTSADVVMGATVESYELSIIDTLTDVCVHMRTSAEWTVVSTLFRLRCLYAGTIFGNNILVRLCCRAIEEDNDDLLTPEVRGDACDGKGSGLLEELQNLIRFLTERAFICPVTSARIRVHNLLKLVLEIDVEESLNAQNSYADDEGSAESDISDRRRRLDYRTIPMEEASNPDIWMQENHHEAGSSSDGSN